MKVKVKVPAQRQAPQKKPLKDMEVWTDVPPVRKEPSLFARCINIIRQDIHDGMNGKGAKRRADKELYRQFCELAEGGKKV